MIELLLIVVGIAVAIWLLRLLRERIQLRLREQKDFFPLGRESMPAVYTIQAQDAAGSSEKLQEILHNLKTENRIKDFTGVDMADDLSSPAQKIGEEDLIVILLTHGLEPRKKEIEERIIALKTDRPGMKAAEIIVDNVVYENEFIIFPGDLRPIRDSDDTDTVWHNIERSLKEWFPERPAEGPSADPESRPIDWPEKWKELVKGVGKALIVYVILVLALFGIVIILIIIILNNIGG